MKKSKRMFDLALAALLAVCLGSAAFGGEKAPVTVAAGKVDGAFYLFPIKNTDYVSVYFGAVLYDPQGKVYTSWDNASIESGVTKNLKLSGIPPAGEYKLTLSFYDEDGDTGSWTWKRKIDVKSFQLSKVFASTDENGAPRHQFVFDQIGYKGSMITMEIYNSAGKLVYSKEGERIGKFQSNYSIYWNYYSFDGGLRCKAGSYTIKYWLDAQNPREMEFTIK